MISWTNVRTEFSSTFAHSGFSASIWIPSGTALKWVNILFFPEQSNTAVQILHALSSTSVVLLCLLSDSPSIVLSGSPSIELVDVMRRCVSSIPKKYFGSPLKGGVCSSLLGNRRKSIPWESYLELFGRSFKSIRRLIFVGCTDVSPSDAMIKGLSQDTSLLYFLAPDTW